MFFFANVEGFYLTKSHRGDDSILSPNTGLVFTLNLY